MAAHKNNRPSKEKMLSQIIDEGMSMRDMAAHYNVSHRMVGKWREAYGITERSYKRWGKRGKAIRYKKIDVLLHDGQNHPQWWIAKKCKVSAMSVSLRWQKLHPGIRYYSPRRRRKAVKLPAPRKAQVRVKPVSVFVAPVVVAKQQIIPARREGVSRGTETGFKAYWADRPYHFGQLWPGKTIAQAWEILQGKPRVAMAGEGVR